MDIDTEKLFWKASDPVFSNIDQIKYEQSEMKLLYHLKDAKLWCLAHDVEKAEQSIETLTEAHQIFWQDWVVMNEGAEPDVCDGLSAYFIEEIEHLKNLYHIMTGDFIDVSEIKMPGPSSVMKETRQSLHHVGHAVENALVSKAARKELFQEGLEDVGEALLE